MCAKREGQEQIAEGSIISKSPRQAKRFANEVDDSILNAVLVIETGNTRVLIH